tara:strand:+ start:411 stop:590 length:180 start_codon:yes stop_codon:yes gene_type:complete
MKDKIGFDKFIKDIVEREEESRNKTKKYVDEHSDHPVREYYKRYRELPQNRIKVGNNKK